MIPPVEERSIRPCICLNPDNFPFIDFKCHFCFMKGGVGWCDAGNCSLQDARSGKISHDYRNVIPPRCGNTDGTCDINYTDDEYQEFMNQTKVEEKQT